MKRSIIFISIFVSMFFSNVHAHDNGFVLNLKANFSGSQTLPSINDADLKLMGASYMKGMMGFIIDGEAELGYIFGSKEYFNMYDNNIFGGMGLFVTLGVGQGYAGQISGKEIPLEGQAPQTVDVFFNAFYTPVVSFSLGTKVYLFKNRMAVGLNVGGKMIADMAPEYEFYSNPAIDGLGPEVGTLIVTDDMIKKMNPLMVTLKASIDYYQPIVERMELILGAYAAYNFYAPGYITMPSTLAEAALADSGFNAINTPLKSFRIDSLDFGLTLGISFKA